MRLVYNTSIFPHSSSEISSGFFALLARIRNRGETAFSFEINFSGNCTVINTLTGSLILKSPRFRMNQDLESSKMKDWKGNLGSLGISMAKGRSGGCWRVKPANNPHI